MIFLANVTQEFSSLTPFFAHRVVAKLSWDEKTWREMSRQTWPKKTISDSPARTDAREVSI